MMCMWQKNYVLRVDIWKKQWSGCSKALQITARSSNLIGHRLLRSLLGLRNGRGLRRRQFLDFLGNRTGRGQRHGSSAALSHLDGDASAVKSLSYHYSFPGPLTEYKRQFQRAFRRPGDHPSIFAIELETPEGWQADYIGGHDEEVRQISLRNEWSVDSWTADDSCGEGCAQLDDFNWFLPADDWVRDILAPESQVDLSDSESDVDDVEPDPVPVQMTMMAGESLCPPWSLRRDLRRAVTQHHPGSCVGDVMS